MVGCGLVLEPHPTAPFGAKIYVAQIVTSYLLICIILMLPVFFFQRPFPDTMKFLSGVPKHHLVISAKADVLPNPFSVPDLLTIVQMH